jgi:DNA-binding transcriptional LysR family regulator
VELRRLRYFIAVAEHLNFRRAAEALETSQPSLSQQIRGLELELGVDLFERTKRHVRLTSAGTEVLAGVRQAVADFDSAAQRGRDAQSGVRGTLTIGAAGMVMIDHLPPIVRAFREAYPDVVLTVTILRKPDLIEALNSGRVELAFSTAPGQDENILSRPMWRLPWRIVLPDTHPLANEQAVHLRDLNGATLITHPRRGGAGANGTIMALCRQQRFTPGAVREVPEVADLETLVGLVACGFGITILPAPFELIRSPLVVFKPIAETNSAQQISACWRADEKSVLVQNFVAAAQLRADLPSPATARTPGGSIRRAARSHRKPIPALQLSK